MTTTLLALGWSLITAAAAAMSLRPRASEASDPARWKGAADAQKMEPAAPRRGDGVLERIGVTAVRGAAQALGRSGWVPADPRAVGAGIVLAGLVVAVLPAVWPGAVVVGVLPTLVSRARPVSYTHLTLPTKRIV